MNTTRHLLEAPGKINIFLEIEGKRHDGYHNIRTLMVRISLWDSLLISYPVEEEVISFTDPSIPANDNTITKALRFLRESGLEIPRLRVSVEKKIPSGTGLGGASSDAGAIISHFISNQSDKLHPLDMAKSVGGDVPFFVYSWQAAWVSGIGEKVSPVEVDPIHVVLIVPPFSISTAWAYAQVSGFGNPLTPQEKERYTVRDIKEVIFNRFLHELKKKHDGIKEIARALEKILPQGSMWSMSGSGAAFFVLTPYEDEAQELKSHIANKLSMCKIIKVRTL